MFPDSRVPKDAKLVLLRERRIEHYVVVTSSCFCLAGVTMAVVFLTFNVYYRKVRFIKLSSPKLNNVAVIGCILTYTGVVLLGMTDQDGGPSDLSIICSVSNKLLCLF